MQRRGIDPIHPIHDELVGGKAASCSNAIAGSIGRLSIDRHSSGAVGDHPDLLEENDDDTHQHDLYLDLNPDIDPGQCLGGELGGASLFALVPEELIRHMFQYMDIASLSSLAQTCRAKTFPSPSASQGQILRRDDVEGGLPQHGAGEPHAQKQDHAQEQCRACQGRGGVAERQQLSEGIIPDATEATVSLVPPQGWNWLEKLRQPLGYVDPH